MSILPKVIYRFNLIPIKISASFFVDTDKLIVIFTWKGPRIPNTILKKKNKGGMTLSDIKGFIKLQ